MLFTVASHRPRAPHARLRLWFELLGQAGVGSADAGVEETAHIVRWIFARRLAGHSVARIARALNDAGVPARRRPIRAGGAMTGVAGP
jgi:hypothetical protein